MTDTEETQIEQARSYSDILWEDYGYPMSLAGVAISVGALMFLIALPDAVNYYGIPRNITILSAILAAILWGINAYQWRDSYVR